MKRWCEEHKTAPVQSQRWTNKRKSVVKNSNNWRIRSLQPFFFLLGFFFFSFSFEADVLTWHKILQQVLRVSSACPASLSEPPHRKPFPVRCGGGDTVEPGLSPTRWHCVHAIQAQGLLLGLFPPEIISRTDLAALAFPPALPGAAGWGCCCEYCQPELCHCHSSQKIKKKRAKLMQGSVRWGGSCC